MAGFKSEAIKFFGLSQDESCKSKQYFKKDIQDFINKHVNLQKNILREYLEENRVAEVGWLSASAK